MADTQKPASELQDLQLAVNEIRDAIRNINSTEGEVEEGEEPTGEAASGVANCFGCFRCGGCGCFRCGGCGCFRCGGCGCFRCGGCGCFRCGCFRCGCWK